jgi:capsular polysaccharide transport system permease protein
LGLGRSQDDSFIVENFITSRDAMERLREKLPLEKMFILDGADFLARYPSVIYGPAREEFFKYYQQIVTVVHTDKTGISILRVRAFRPTDAHEIAETLLGLSEDLVNRINQRLQTDAVGNNLKELQNSQARLIAAQAALTDFRNQELLIDPERNAVALGDLIARLSSDLGEVQAQIAEMKAGSTSSPQLPNLYRRAVALQEQIDRERGRIAGNSDGLASRLAAYERLTLERQFANRMLSSAETELAKSRAEATRQLLYLERVVEPHLADSPTRPKRFSDVITTFGANAIFALIGWLILSGVREHASRPQ